jgi:hypothetical protein
MGDNWFRLEADEALTRHETDPSARRLLNRVQAVLDLLESDPRHESLRRRRFRAPPLWCVTVVAGNDVRAILWEPHPTEPDDVFVHYIGPDSFG